MSRENKRKKNREVKGGSRNRFYEIICYCCSINFGWFLAGVRVIHCHFGFIKLLSASEFLYKSEPGESVLLI